MFEESRKLGMNILARTGWAVPGGVSSNGSQLQVFQPVVGWQGDCPEMPFWLPSRAREAKKFIANTLWAGVRSGGWARDPDEEELMLREGWFFN